jgi:DNA-binding transcriptional ArsR family regulator
MLKILNDRAASPAEMARELGEPDVSKVSFHARRLRDLGFAELVEERRGRRGSLEHVYRATEQHLLELTEWQKLAEDCPELADHLVGEYMQAIVDDFVAGGQLGIGRDENFHITRTRVLLDLEGLTELVGLFEDFRLQVLEAQERALARGGATVPVSSSHALFRLADF